MSRRSFFLFLLQTHTASSHLILISTLVIIAPVHVHAASASSSHLPLPVSQQLHLADTFPLPAGAVGPESFAFDPLGGGPYTGVSDGRILKWDESVSRWLDFATVSPSPRAACEGLGDDKELMEETCGRPLGLMFNHKTGELYIADAYKGLLVVGPSGGLATQILTHANGVPFGFTNGLDIDQGTGLVYFTDSSTRFQRRNHILVILSGDVSGRLMRYDPQTKQTTLLLDNLAFPNGLALSENGDYILVAETTRCRILRYWMKTATAGTVDVFSDLEGYPDNVKRNDKGEFWVGIHSKRSFFVGMAVRFPWLGTVVLKLMPFDPMKLISMTARWRGGGFAVKLSEQGLITATLAGKNGTNRWASISEVAEKDGYLWIGSVTMPFAGVIDTKT
uniref:Strictosidine synthase conserved region domain-containing protein n=1 Tax=Kalanchoe fedtschenkoi TaxID=63787 RepID=A0A7N0TX81_KALFE